MIEAQLNIFVLEDVKTDQELIKRQVLKFSPNSTITIAHNHKSFHKKIQWTKPDMIIADYFLPDMTGLDALLYAKEKMPEVPFVFVSQYLDHKDYVAESILLGADGYLSKTKLRSLPEYLIKVMEVGVAKKVAMAEKLKNENKKKILLQKLEAKILDLEDGTLQTELQSILQKIVSL